MGFVFYSFCTFVQDPFYLLGFVDSPLHYIHLMFVTLVFSIATTLFLSSYVKVGAPQEKKPFKKAIIYGKFLLMPPSS